ncbi:Crp/Fnr family transcriptional regulator [Qipengyuania spongiae]|uniref:Crp/Fnr family transcriptional regulator n=1 Tax=Qipengyuania spongiae TaxID=2909673 RepID=UPI003B9715C6
MHRGLFSRCSFGREFRPETLRIFENAISSIETIEGHYNLTQIGDNVRHVHYLIEGSTVRYLDDICGSRQVTGIGLCGEFLDLDNVNCSTRSYGIYPLERVQVALIPIDVFIQVLQDHPDLMEVLWLSALQDAIYWQRWLFRLGRLRGEQRIAHFLCELIERLRLLERFDGERVNVPLRQLEYAEACGMTSVHANRCFRNLQERELVIVEGCRNVRVRSEKDLCELGQFKPMDRNFNLVTLGRGLGSLQAS